MRINDNDALFVVDVQPTFMPGGELPVSRGDDIIAVGLKLMPLFPKERRFASLDRHPPGHISFASSYIGAEPVQTVLTLQNMEMYPLSSSACFSRKTLIAYLEKVGEQCLWPDHALDGTQSAELHPKFRIDDFGHVVTKGLDPGCDSYSASQDAIGRSSGIIEAMRQREVNRCFFWGLTYEYCVGYTALDVSRNGFEVFIVEDAVRAVDQSEAAMRKNRDRLQRAGVRMVSAEELLH